MWPDEAALTALARVFALHALPIFFAALGVVLVFAGLICRLARCYLTPPIPRPSSPLLRLFAIYLPIALAALTTFAYIAGEIGTGEALPRLDEVFSTEVGQTVSPRTRAVFAAITHLGDPLTLTLLGMIVAIALLLHRKHWLALGWVLVISGNAIINPMLKGMFERARPLHENGIILASGWSFPSGHSSGAVVVYGMLAYVGIRSLPRQWHLPVVLLASAMAFAVGCSRIFLQVHFASDVVAGFMTGIAWLALCIAGMEMIRHHLHGQH